MQFSDTASPVLPATSTELDRYQRARLIRSTRKLEAILGATPHLVDTKPILVALPQAQSPVLPSTKASRRHASIFTIFPLNPPSHDAPSDASIYSLDSTNSSMSSFLLPDPYPDAITLPTPKSFSAKARRPAVPPKPLVLRVNTVPVPPGDHRIPLSPFTVSQEPPTPTLVDVPHPPSGVELRRKRMAKLTRTFGENVPVEYVFPPAPSMTSCHQQSDQQVSRQQMPPRTKSSTKTWTTGSRSGAWVGEWNRKDIKDVQRELRTLKVT